MEQYKMALALVPAVVLAGCIGGLSPEAQSPDSTAVSPEQLPGVTNGTLTNASALIETNRNAVRTTGAVVQINQSSDRMTFGARLVVGANVSTYSLSGARPASDGQSTTVDQWSNQTTRFVRTSSDEETEYRVLDGHDERLTLLSSVGEFLLAGDFEVANETSSGGDVVLTADSVSAANTSMVDAGSFESRLVVDESGQIQDLSVTATRGGQTVTYSYELLQAGVESAPKPEWIDDVPPGASVQAQLSVDVEDESYLTLEHSGGDAVPSATTVQVESNGTTDTVRVGSALAAGDTRYVYFSASSRELRVTADRPDPSAVSPVTSPVSVRLETEGGGVLYSGSIGWGSKSTSERGAESSDSSGTAKGTSTDGPTGSETTVAA